MGKNIFAYGSLMFPEVMFRLVSGRDYKHCPGVLKGYARKSVKDAVYPGIVQS